MTIAKAAMVTRDQRLGWANEEPQRGELHGCDEETEPE
jgi:hypothetical protein